jgi:ribonuclease-3
MEATGPTSLTDWAHGALGHRFAQPALLEEALTHSSAGPPDYERLEFLGDRVLGCVIAAWAVGATTDDAGGLNRRQAALVVRSTCAEVARALGVAEQLRMDRAALNAQVQHSDNALADTIEALIGAVFVDGGFAAAEAAVKRAWGQRLDASAAPVRDPKSRLQEWAQARGPRLPDYAVVEREGPDHAPRFRVRVTVSGLDPVEATGATKQEAQMNAAAAMLERARRLDASEEANVPARRRGARS